MIILLGMFCWVSACAGGENNKAAPDPESQKEQEQQMTKEQAEKIAGIHVALKGWRWGEPQEVVEKEGKFYLSYKTPEKELRLVGVRTLTVDKETGIVSLPRRR